MEIQGTIKIECNKCGKVHTFNAEDADFQKESEPFTKTGNQVLYIWKNEFYCECGNLIEITYEAWEDEYGRPIEDASQPIVKGGRLIGKGFHFFPVKPNEDEL